VTPFPCHKLRPGSCACWSRIDGSVSRTHDHPGGTSSSLPVLYVAGGRRLHCALSLVGAKCHLFLRWEDQTTRLNIEGALLGMNTYDDAHYRAWP